MRRIIPALLCLLLLAGCGKEAAPQAPDTPLDTHTEQSSSSPSADLDAMDFSFSSRDSDTSIPAGATTIALEKEGAEISGAGAAWKDGRLLLTAEGSYIISGATEGYIEIDADGKKLQLILNGAAVNNQDGPALYIKAADKVFLTLNEGTKNVFADGEDYTFTADEGLDGAVFSRADLTINGGGTLSVSGNRKHAIVSKDDLVIAGGNIDVRSAGVGLEGKDCVKITAAKIAIDAGSDGIRSSNAEDPARGFVFVADGSLDIIAENDGIQGETAVKIEGGSLNISTGGGSANSSQNASGGWNEGWMHPSGEGFGGDTANTATESAKGIKAALDLIISGGTLALDTADDSVHSNGNITVAGGVITASSGDDGMHADSSLEITDGTIKILKSYEGIEATDIKISGGNTDLVATDDGLNAAGGNDGSSMGGRPGMGHFAEGTGSIVLSGGKLQIDASGDGVDSNGTLLVEGGETYVSGPQNSGNGALDYGSSATVTGGTFVAVGAGGMAAGFTAAQNQGAIFVNISSTVSGGETLSLKAESGETIVEFVPAKSFSSVVISHENIKQGETYTLYVGENEVGEIEMTELLYGSSGGMGGPGGMGRPGDMGDRPGKPNRW